MTERSGAVGGEVAVTGSWIFWDFDGTLARRRDGWTLCMTRLLDETYPELSVTADRVRPFLSSGFPWHEPTITHVDVDADAWWTALNRRFSELLKGLGCDDHAERGVLEQFRSRYVDPREFELLEDARSVLAALAARGWRQLILSNHVPELAAIVQGLGIDCYFEAVLSSGVTGYEKPHPAAFAAAVEIAGTPSRVWMIGDNVDADVRGAIRAGLPAILIGRPTHSEAPAAETLRDVLAIVGSP